jgi:hypothetical protein
MLLEEGLVFAVESVGALNGKTIHGRLYRSPAGLGLFKKSGLRSERLFLLSSGLPLKRRREHNEDPDYLFFSDGKHAKSG